MEAKRIQQSQEVIAIIHQYCIEKYKKQLSSMICELYSIYPLVPDCIDLRKKELEALGVNDQKIELIHKEAKKEATEEVREKLVAKVLGKKMTVSSFWYKCSVFPKEHEEALFNLALEELTGIFSYYHSACKASAFPTMKKQFKALTQAWKMIIKNYLNVLHPNQKVSLPKLREMIHPLILEKLISLSPQLKATVETEEALLMSQSFDEEHEKEVEGDSSELSPKPKLTDYMKNAGLIGLPEELEVALSPIIPISPMIDAIKEKLQIKPEKGLLLCGPPGTGKTAFARHLAVYLGCPLDRLVLITGTEILNKWVGGSEQNIRNLFAPARADFAKYGKKSHLHVVVLDEIDSILSSRRDSDSQNDRNLVNQILGEMDGVNEIDNILVIGTTNNLDFIDEAALRTGRFGAIVKFTLPDEKTRRDIFESYLEPIKLAEMIRPDFDLEAIIEATAQFSGADIKGVVMNVKKQLLARFIHAQLLLGENFLESMEPSQRQASQADFLSAIASISLGKKENGITAPTEKLT